MKILRVAFCVIVIPLSLAPKADVNITDNSAFELPQTDFLGNPRIIDGNNDGLFNLDVPLDVNGEITVWGFCSGHSPSKKVLTPDEALYFNINLTRAPPGSSQMTINFQAEPGATKSNWVRIWGTITYDDQDLCAMVLANGQHMFSCGNNLGTFSLEVPLDENGEITLYVFCSGKAPYKYVFAP
jgi:hypothetical protein